MKVYTKIVITPITKEFEDKLEQNELVIDIPKLEVKNERVIQMASKAIYNGITRRYKVAPSDFEVEFR